MVGKGDTDWLNLKGQEGVNPTICLSHNAGVDFDFAVYNDNRMVCQKLGLSPTSCCKVKTPGTVKVKVWSYKGSGNYKIVITP